MSILRNANDSVNLVKAALDAKTALVTAEEKEKLADAKLALANLKEIIADLKEDNQSLKSQLQTKNGYVLEKGVYWDVHDTRHDQPFCPVCYTRGLIVPLQKAWEGRHKTETIWSCPDNKCGGTFNPWDHEERESGIVTSRPGSFDPNTRY
jgi:hypothetical protein